MTSPSRGCFCPGPVCVCAREPWAAGGSYPGWSDEYDAPPGLFVLGAGFVVRGFLWATDIASAAMHPIDTLQDVATRARRRVNRAIPYCLRF